MSTQIQLDSSRPQKDVPVHILPCHIAYDGPSKVSQYFKPRTDTADQTISTSLFRGRKLQGKAIPLPKNYSGITLIGEVNSGNVFRPVDSSTRFDKRKYACEEDEEEEVEITNWESCERFDTITVWEHHTLPDSKEDHWIRGIEEWIAMADVVNQTSDVIRKAKHNLDCKAD